MLAKIRTKNGFYTSIVFAIFYERRNQKALVLNQDYTELKFIYIWNRLKRNIVIFNAEKQGWITEKKNEGYEWVLENITKGFFKTKINPCILEKCKELQNAVKDYEWFQIKNETDIESLLYAACDFHDAYVKKMYVDGGKQYIHFNTTWDSEILFELEGNIDTNLVEKYGAMLIGNDYPTIFYATIFFENGLTYWFDEEPIKDLTQRKKGNQRYFCANTVKWKLILPL